MSQTAVKELICDICGSEVRDGSMFCYNCGSAVSGPDEVTQEKAANQRSRETRTNGVSDGEDNDLVKYGTKTRVRPRKRAIQNRDVVWEGREDMSIGFVATTIVLVLVTVVIVIAGFYFR